MWDKKFNTYSNTNTVPSLVPHAHIYAVTIFHGTLICHGMEVENYWSSRWHNGCSQMWPCSILNKYLWYAKVPFSLEFKWKYFILFIKKTTFLPHLNKTIRHVQLFWDCRRKRKLSALFPIIFQWRIYKLWDKLCSSLIHKCLRFLLIEVLAYIKIMVTQFHIITCWRPFGIWTLYSTLQPNNFKFFPSPELELRLLPDQLHCPPSFQLCPLFPESGNHSGGSFYMSVNLFQNYLQGNWLKRNKMLLHLQMWHLN